MLCEMLSKFPQLLLPSLCNSASVQCHCDLIDVLLIWQFGNDDPPVCMCKAKCGHFEHRHCSLA